MFVSFKIRIQEGEEEEEVGEEDSEIGECKQLKLKKVTILFNCKNIGNKIFDMTVKELEVRRLRGGGIWC